jgi:hypothetical protein
MAIPLSSSAAELEPLKQFINRKPQFISDKSDAQFVATRCSALYFILGSRAEEASKTKDVQNIAKDYTERAVIYEKARAIFSRVAYLKGELSNAQQKDFAKSYTDITLVNWKKSGDIFEGMVNDDLGVCRDNYVYFKKLATNLSKEAKK